MRKLVSLVTCGILLGGCASSSPITMMITDDTALISVLGQGAGDTEKMKIFNEALAEAALITHAHGYRYFVIVDTADATQTGVKVRRGVPVHGVNYTTPDRRTPYVRLGLDITIRMYRDGDVNPASPGVWNSDTVPGGR